MNKFINTALFALIITNVANNTWCSDAGLPSEDEVNEFVRIAKNSDNGMKFDAASINGSDRWQLLNARAAVARLAYASGMGTRGTYEFIGNPSWTMSVEEQVAQIRDKALEAGLVANLDALLAVEALEAEATEKAGSKRAHEVKMRAKEATGFYSQRDRRIKELETAMDEAYSRGDMDNASNIQKEMRILAETKFPGVL